MDSKENLFSELTNEELNSINGGTVRIITVYRDGELVQITVYD